MNRIKSCLIAVSLIACAFSSTPATAAPVDSSPPITSDHVASVAPPVNEWLPSLAIVVPFYANALNLEQALPADRWRDIIAPIALAFAACAYMAKRFRSLGCAIRYLKHLAKEQWQWLNRTCLRLKLVLLNLLSLCDLRALGASSYRTANATAPADQPKNEMVELLSKGAGVDPADVYWRVARGLTPKQAVDVAAQEALERKVDAYAKKVKDKDDAEIRDLAKKAGVDQSALPGMSRQQLLIAIVRADKTAAGEPLPGEDIRTTTTTKLASDKTPAADEPNAPAKKTGAKKAAAKK